MALTSSLYISLFYRCFLSRHRGLSCESFVRRVTTCSSFAIENSTAFLWGAINRNCYTGNETRNYIGNGRVSCLTIFYFVNKVSHPQCERTTIGSHSTISFSLTLLLVVVVEVVVVKQHIQSNNRIYRPS